MFFSIKTTKDNYFSMNSDCANSRMDYVMMSQTVPDIIMTGITWILFSNCQSHDPCWDDCSVSSYFFLFLWGCPLSWIVFNKTHILCLVVWVWYVFLLTLVWSGLRMGFSGGRVAGAEYDPSSFCCPENPGLLGDINGLKATAYRS